MSTCRSSWIDTGFQLSRGGHDVGWEATGSIRSQQSVSRCSRLGEAVQRLEDRGNERGLPRSRRRAYLDVVEVWRRTTARARTRTRS